MKSLNVSQIQRELHLLKDFDIIEVIDKKQKRTKGYFVDAKYAKAIEELDKQKKKKNISKYVGLWKDKDVELKDLRQKAWRK